MLGAYEGIAKKGYVQALMSKIAAEKVLGQNQAVIDTIEGLKIFLEATLANYQQLAASYAAQSITITTLQNQIAAMQEEINNLNAQIARLQQR